MVVDCGGGTVDITVHEIGSNSSGAKLKELFKATGGPYGSVCKISRKKPKKKLTICQPKL
jgi:hypothetical protein